MTEKELPRWDMTNVYPSLNSIEFKADFNKFKRMIKDLEDYVNEHQIGPNSVPALENSEIVGEICVTFMKDYNTAALLGLTLYNYVNSFANTDTSNMEANKSQSAIQSLWVKITLLEDVFFKSWLGTLGDILPKIIESRPFTKEHAFYLCEAAEQSRYLMSEAEEKLVGELSLYGSNAWTNLANEVKSKLMWGVQDEQNREKDLPIAAIMNLFDHPEEKMRQRGYEAAMGAFASVEHILAAALNGVKGTQLIKFTHRNRVDALHDSLDNARIDRETLDAMIGAVRSNFTMLRKFYQVKAKRLGKETLPFWDLNVFTARTQTKYSYQQAQNFVFENFSAFSEELAGLAKRAFDNNWIDVGPREGKVGGGYCVPLYSVEESRILLNFEENLNWTFVLAHELGHAFHYYCQRGKTRYNRKLTTTLGETASIMCETIVTNAAIQQAKTDNEELVILEASLNNAIGNNIVGPYTLFGIESEVFTRLPEGKLSAKELNSITEKVQVEILGEVLDKNYCFKYWWARWPHLFFNSLSFYNYGYTFGLLLGVGLYAVYQERGQEFVPQYMEFLSSTGKGNAADLATQFDIDLRSPSFWEQGLNIIAERIDRYAELTG